MKYLKGYLAESASHETTFPLRSKTAGKLDLYVALRKADDIIGNYKFAVYIKICCFPNTSFSFGVIENDIPCQNPVNTIFRSKRHILYLT